MSAAQDEFNQLVSNNRHIPSSHPEDRDNASDHSDEPSDEATHPADDLDDLDDDYHSAMGSRTATYHIPNTVYDANTGPKGVIADAQAFERARKRSFRKTLLSAAGIDTHRSDDANLLQNSPPPDGSMSDEEAGFMRKWRESRMAELQGRGQRHSSPRRKRYGSVKAVDAVGYLDAIEKVTPDTVVVVCVYDQESSASAIVEDCLNTVARRQPTTRFIKLSHDIAEMDHIEAPAILAYKGGDVFATIVDIHKHIPKGRSCSPDSLEDLLKVYRVL